MLIGYARVSTEAQDTEIQMQQLTDLGCEQIFTEKRSGTALENRDQLQRAIDVSRKGDVIVVMKLDRLARSTRDALNIADQLKDKGVGLRLEDLSIDVNSTTGRMVYSVMSSVAEMEANRIKERCDLGRINAKEKGIHLGRPAMIKKSKIIKLSEKGTSQTDIAKIMGISRATVTRAIKEHKENAA